MAQPLTISLGGQAIELKPLTLRAIREIDQAFAGDPPADAKEREAFFFDRYVCVVALAMQRANPAVTIDTVLDMEASFTELATASRMILEASGLVRSGEAAAASSNGATSTAS